MALSFPLTRAQFFDVMPISTLRLDLPEQMQLSRTGAGEQLAADLGERLWQGEVALGRLTALEAGRADVLLDLLRQAGRSFLAYDVRRPWPIRDPGGVLLGAATPTLELAQSGNRDIRLAGLPAGYGLEPGDFLSFAYGASPVRYGLHRVAEPAVAAGNGKTPLFEVTPALRPGAQTGAAVTLNRPFCKAVLIPGSVETGTGGRRIYQGTTFQFVQSLR